MNVRLETVGKVAVVILEGRLDFATAEGFQKQLELVLAGIGSVPPAVVIDCAALQYISSAGLRVLLVAAKAAQRARIAFCLCSLTAAVRDVLDVSGFSRIVTVYADRGVALAQVPQG
ncbi:MAG: STAS domain-containing protein [Proteobacteria bacterium]|nr:STAS domain-containing protein [Pseudomonadota bacterium]